MMLTQRTLACSRCEAYEHIHRYTLMVLLHTPNLSYGKIALCCLLLAGPVVLDGHVGSTGLPSLVQSLANHTRASHYATELGIH